MAKATKTKAAPAKEEKVSTTTTVVESETTESPKAKKMSKADAQAIVKQYDGINGAAVPTELAQARKILSEAE